MSNTDQCRDTKKLNKLVQIMLAAALAEIKAKGVNPLVIETYRTRERQNYLYGQGRTKAQCLAAGVPATYARPGATQVTWTLNSMHCLKKAVDIIPVRKGKAIWNAADKDTQTIIAVMEKYGFEAGANWSKSPDSPHFQVIATFTSVFDQSHNTIYVTKAIQRALKTKGFYNGAIDGKWGSTTTKAVNAFRKSNKWTKNGKVGKVGLKKLLKCL